jgi:hypothetical protein
MSACLATTGRQSWLRYQPISCRLLGRNLARSICYWLGQRQQQRLEQFRPHGAATLQGAKQVAASLDDPPRIKGGSERVEGRGPIEQAESGRA